MNALYIDTTSRKLIAYAVSITAVNEDLVLRFAAELPKIPKDNIDYLLVDMRGYEAQSSYGFTEVSCTYYTKRKKVIGLCGFPWAPSLRAVSPYYVAAVSCADIRRIATHKNSNEATAAAAKDLLKLSLDDSKIEGIVLEGQSDYTNALYFTGQRYTPEIPEEHRSDIFTTENIAVAQLRYYYRDAKEKKDGLAFIAASLIMLKSSRLGDLESLNISPETARVIYERYKALGWKLDVDTKVINHFARAISPEGKTITSGALIRVEPEIEEKFFNLAGVELKRQATGTDRAWVSHIGP